MRSGRSRRGWHTNGPAQRLHAEVGQEGHAQPGALEGTEAFLQSVESVKSVVSSNNLTGARSDGFSRFRSAM